ncbi:MAG: ATP-binding protein [Planctomycetes bacterium]|nr:ATP-binding protein [Planctomycetota bacterium]
MVFVGGPRQVGKTTLALHILGAPGVEHPGYLNWDFIQHKDQILRGDITAASRTIVYDEIHKYPKWRNLLKGVFDRYRATKQILVTGSARLDHYRRGGDSLQGRYHYYRLHPFSAGELLGKCTLDELLKFGGFPEPLFAQNEQTWRRWQREHRARVVHEDIVSLERISEVSRIDLLVSLLPERVGSPVSLANLSRDLQVSHETVARWISILESLYVCFRLSPHGFSKTQSVKKEQKLYLWDWSLCADPGSRFENMTACALLKYCHFIEDTEGYSMDLRYLRHREGKEVDFIVLRDKKIECIVECKLGETRVAPQLLYFRKHFPTAPMFQVHTSSEDYESTESRIRVTPFVKFVGEWNLP